MTLSDVAPKRAFSIAFRECKIQYYIGSFHRLLLSKRQSDHNGKKNTDKPCILDNLKIDSVQFFYSLISIDD